MREPSVSGTFYPDDPVKLRRDLERYLGSIPASESSTAPVRAAVVPHAGYPYSGSVAAGAFQLLRGAIYDLVLLLGPSHRFWFDGVSVAPFSSYKTPLGNLQVERKAVEGLLATGAPFVSIQDAHFLEHSLEVQLPWLQHLLQPGFSILPLLFGSLDEASQLECGRTLHELFYRKGTLFLCSTDLSHDHLYDEALTMDSRVRDAVVRRDRAELSRLFSSGDGEACGRMGLLSLLACLEEEELHGRVSGFSNSGDVVGDRRSRIVGYLSAVFEEVLDAPEE